MICAQHITLVLLNMVKENYSKRISDNVLRVPGRNFVERRNRPVTPLPKYIQGTFRLLLLYAKIYPRYVLVVNFWSSKFKIKSCPPILVEYFLICLVINVCDRSLDPVTSWHSYNSFDDLNSAIDNTWHLSNAKTIV